MLLVHAPYTTIVGTTQWDWSFPTRRGYVVALAHRDTQMRDAHRSRRSKTRNMIGIAVIVSFFAALFGGSLIADALGVLPNADQLQEQDRQKWACYRRWL